MNWIKKSLFWFLTFFSSLVVALMIFELGSKFISPISPGVKKIDPKSGEVLRISFIQPGAVYIQEASEYRARTTIDENGNRTVISSNDKSPLAVIFLGDSFTFGLGVADDKTIAHKVCEKLKARCSNLGLPRTGLVLQEEKLRHFFEQSSRDLNGAYLFHLLLMSNDLLDTEAEHKKKKAEHKKKKTSNVAMDFIALKNLSLDFSRWLTRHSNGFRVLRIVFGHQLREFAFQNKRTVVSSGQISIFARYFFNIKKLAEERGVIYVPVLLSTSAELNLGKDFVSFEVLSRELKTDLKRLDYGGGNTDSLFYPLDGHHNEKGTSLVARNILRFMNEFKSE